MTQIEIPKAKRAAPLAIVAFDMERTHFIAALNKPLAWRLTCIAVLAATRTLRRGALEWLKRHQRPTSAHAACLG